LDHIIAIEKRQIRIQQEQEEKKMSVNKINLPFNSATWLNSWLVNH